MIDVFRSFILWELLRASNIHYGRCVSTRVIAYNWSSFQLAITRNPIKVTSSGLAPSAKTRSATISRVNIGLINFRFSIIVGLPSETDRKLGCQMKRGVSKCRNV